MARNDIDAMEIFPPAIDLTLLAEAAAEYEARGFARIEVPWIVSPESDFATKPKGVLPFVTLGGHLVASGEQGFLEMIARGELPPGRWQTLTPCFRDEERLDLLHRTYFLKIELIDTRGEVSPGERLREVVAAAGEVLTRLVGARLVERPTADPSSEGSLDIEEERTGIELGSYGIRRTERHGLWVYGTGLAEPRGSSVRRLARADEGRERERVDRKPANEKTRKGENP